MIDNDTVNLRPASKAIFSHLESDQYLPSSPTMAKSAEVKLAIFGRAGVGKSGELFLVAFIGSVSLSRLWEWGR